MTENKRDSVTLIPCPNCAAPMTVGEGHICAPTAAVVAADVAGATAACEACGVSVGPVTGYPGASVLTVCHCGKRLEAWPS